jgi:hypothetical protein
MDLLVEAVAPAVEVEKMVVTELRGRELLTKDTKAVVDSTPAVAVAAVAHRSRDRTPLVLVDMVEQEFRPRLLVLL